MNFFAELKRRNVYKVAVAYAVVGWLAIQISSTVLPPFHAPEWVVQTFSSACTTKRFPSSRCASAIQIVRPLESMAETQPQLQPALLRLSAMISQYFMLCLAWLLFVEQRG